MRLFFETSAQAEAFLFTIPLGLLLAAGFDLTFWVRRGRALMDVALLLLCAAALLYLIAFMRDEGLRVYHLLALCIGAVIYTQGVGRLLRTLKRRLLRRQANRISEPKSN